MNYESNDIVDKQKLLGDLNTTVPNLTNQITVNSKEKLSDNTIGHIHSKLNGNNTMKVLASSLSRNNSVQQSVMKPIVLEDNILLGHSLFRAVSPYRTCQDMFIPDHFCTCITTKPIDLVGKLAQEAAQFLIKEINSKIQQYPLCQHWKLHKVSSIDCLIQLI